MIKTGVINANNVDSETLNSFITEGINTGYEDWLRENPDATYQERYEYESNGDTYLLGFATVKKDSGEVVYDVDVNSPLSAIYDPNDNTVQVVHSNHIKIGCRECSPCYPNQLDLNSHDGEGVAYCFPFDDITQMKHSPVDYTKFKEQIKVLVLVEMEGGIVVGVRQPENVYTEVRDYGEDGENYETDVNGKEYFTRW